MRSRSLLAFGLAACLAGSARANLTAYWSFDAYTTGSNPTGMPDGDNPGSYADLTGNGNTAYGAEFSPLDYLPYDATGGLGGSGAFYSANNNNDGALAVVADSTFVNFNQEDFTISFWEKVKFRDVEGSGWAPGRGRSQFFTKAPYIPLEDPNVTTEGFGLNLTQNHFDVLANTDDNFGQTSLGARYTYPTDSSADDSGVWAHWAMTGQYNAGSDDYTITVYLNGNAVDWDGATGTSFTVANDIIDNTGDLTIGSFWRNDDYATQRFISWNMSTDQATDLGEGWMDDFAMWNELLSSQDLADLAAGTTTPADWLSTGLVGDYNNNNQVEQGDLDLVLLNWGDPDDPPPAGWINDLPTAPAINQDELDGVLLNWGNSAAGPASGVVPEPASASLLLIGGLLLGRLRRND